MLHQTLSEDRSLGDRKVLLRALIPKTSTHVVVSADGPSAGTIQMSEHIHRFSAFNKRQASTNTTAMHGALDNRLSAKSIFPAEQSDIPATKQNGYRTPVIAAPSISRPVRPSPPYNRYRSTNNSFGNIPEPAIANGPVYVTPKEWQQSVFSVFDPSRLKLTRARNLIDDLNMREGALALTGRNGDIICSGCCEAISQPDLYSAYPLQLTCAHVLCPECQEGSTECPMCQATLYHQKHDPGTRNN